MSGTTFIDQSFMPLRELFFIFLAGQIIYMEYPWGTYRVKLQNPFVKKKQVLRSFFHLNNRLNVPLNLKEKYTLKFFS